MADGLQKESSTNNANINIVLFPLNTASLFKHRQKDTVWSLLEGIHSVALSCVQNGEKKKSLREWIQHYHFSTPDQSLHEVGVDVRLLALESYTD